MKHELQQSFAHIASLAQMIETHELCEPDRNAMLHGIVEIADKMQRLVEVMPESIRVERVKPGNIADFD